MAKRAALCVVVLTLCVLTAFAAKTPSIAGGYNVLLRGENFSFDPNMPSQPIGGLTTLKIAQAGSLILIDIAPCGEMPALQLRGQVGGDVFVSVGNGSHPIIMRGHLLLDKGALTGNLLYPWAADGGEKPKPPPKFLGVAELAFVAVRDTGAGSPFKSEDIDKPKPPPALGDIAPSMDLIGKYRATAIFRLFSALKGQEDDSKGEMSFSIGQRGAGYAVSFAGIPGMLRTLTITCQAGGSLIIGARWDPKDQFSDALFYGRVQPDGGMLGVLAGPAVWDDTDIVHQPGGPISWLLCDRFGALKFVGGGEDGTRAPNPPPPPSIEF